MGGGEAYTCELQRRSNWRTITSADYTDNWAETVY